MQRTRLRKEIAEWIERILETRSWSMSRLSKETGGEVGVSTLHRARKWDDPDGHVLSMPKIRALEAASGIRAPEWAGDAPPGFAEPESYPVSHNEIPAEMKPAHPDQLVFRLNTRAVELPPHGYMPGDRVMIDRRLSARKGDVVCAQVIDRQAGTAETVWRVYDPPFLYPRTTDMDVPHKPLTVDGERVDIVGPIVKSLRMRENAA